LFPIPVDRLFPPLPATAAAAVLILIISQPTTFSPKCIIHRQQGDDLLSQISAIAQIECRDPEVVPFELLALLPSFHVLR
jgi:hypothetical protein